MESTTRVARPEVYSTVLMSLCFMGCIYVPSRMFVCNLYLDTCRVQWRVGK